jgi:PKD repeat protein
MYGCVGSDTINVILRHYPEVDLGNDTTVCEGTEVALDAGNGGIEYFWNTGETTSTIEADATGNYSVMVTNAEGCTGMDTVMITMSGQLPSIDYIQPYNNGLYTFTYTAVNPQNVNGYEWDFGDGSPTSNAQMPTHTYDSVGNYVVTLKVSSDCGYIYDSTSAHIVGIGEINANGKDVVIYPNPTKGSATITVHGDLKMKNVAVYDVVGKELLNVKAESAHKHVLSLSGMASGLYTVKIMTDKGEVTRKLEIIK